MTSSQRNRLYFLVAMIVLSLVLIAPTFFRGQLPDWWPGKPIKLGLDLRGGSYLVLTVDTKEAVKSHLSSVGTRVRSDLRKQKVGVLRTRVVGERGLEVTLINKDGVTEADKLIRQNFSGLAKSSGPIGDAPSKVTYELTPADAALIEREAIDRSIETIRNRVDGFGVAEASIQRSGENRVIVQLPDVTNLETVKNTIGSVAKLEFRMVVDGGTGNRAKEPLPQRQGGTLNVEEEVQMSGDSVERADIEINPQTNEVEVNLALNAFGSDLFDRLTQENVGRNMAIVLDGIVQSAPVIRERISGGRASISGGFTIDEARQLKIILQSGALPAPLIFEEQRVIGATLGADSIKSGIIGMSVGCALVVVFMVLYYKKAGAQAVVCTAINLILLLALLSLFGATLTLPGIAGLALTVGMAVDANIIIFERIRDEIRAGTAKLAAIQAGFDKAHWTILDANLTTLLSGVVLYAFGTGPIKGFAVTLCIGIVTTMIAALFASRLFMEMFDISDRTGSLSI